MNNTKCNLCNGRGKLSFTKGTKIVNKVCIRCKGYGSIKKLVPRHSVVTKDNINTK